MSNDIRVFDPKPDWMDEAEPMKVTAVYGSPRLDLREDDPDERKGTGRSVQFTIGRGVDRQLTIMTEAQVLDLMATLSRRLACADGFASTDPLDELRVQHDGTKVVVEEW